MSKKLPQLSYIDYQKDYGRIFHLILDVNDFDDSTIKFCAYHNKGKFLSINDFPIFYTASHGFLMAIDYTIIYPKIYVKKYKEFDYKTKLKRSYIH